MNIHAGHSVSFDQLRSIQGIFYKPLWEQDTGSENKKVGQKIEVKMNWQAIGLKLLLSPDLSSNNSRLKLKN